MCTKFGIRFQLLLVSCVLRNVYSMKNLKILMNEKCFRKKIDLFMQLCTVSLCKFQGKVLFPVSRSLVYENVCPSSRLLSSCTALLDSVCVQTTCQFK